MFMIVTLIAVLRLSRRGSKFVLSITAYLVYLAFMLFEGPLSPANQKLLSDIPKDPDTITKHFHLDNEFTVYAVCPKRTCHRTYKPTMLSGSSDREYPMHCSHRDYEGGSICGTRLTRPRTIKDVEIQVPIKTFVAFSFKEYLAKLLARPEFEEKMDASWNNLSNDGEMRDIFDGEFLREFKYNGKHFSQGEGEGRYVFGLGFDGFNPHTNKQAGKKYSLALILLVCFNIPREDRYKPENMFLAGVLPGPHEPPLTALNHYSTPIVDDFLEFWNTGVKYSRTALHEFGRLVRVALVALICDLLAARKISGFGAPTCEHFCTFCHVVRSEGGWYNADRESWVWRTKEECRLFASQHKAAKNEKARDKVFNLSGIRHSELERLPYFDFTKSIVVDPMHNLLLGLIKEHLRILGVSLPKFHADPVIELHLPRTPQSFSENEINSIEKLRKKLELPLSETIRAGREKVVKQIEGYHLKSLRFVSQNLGCSLSHIDEPLRSQPDSLTKANWASAIVNWVCLLLFFPVTTS
jgi:hypothetical protein